MRPDHSLAGNIGAEPPRCRACQLQLCKSREARPHAALAETARAEHLQETTYQCNTCGTMLVRSGDLGQAGWSRLRPARLPLPPARLPPESLPPASLPLIQSAARAPSPVKERQ